MDETLTCVVRAAEPSPALWKSVPLEFALSAVAILLAAGLKLLGVMP
ncbi:hypothetical protein [Methylobacterium haplocladii]|nr:hypothetical protein [Methylobacterium haplocladii]GJD83946.1 hypothetical protein HPGCJGGD_1821 [Methylobacterium haplocladii]